MSPTCLMLYSPKLTTVDTDTLMTTIKSQSREDRGGMKCTVCAQLNTYLHVHVCCIGTTLYVLYFPFSRMYRAEKLPNTNLVFLITDAKATCLSCDPRPLRQAEQPCILSLGLKTVLSFVSSILHKPHI